MSYAEVLIDDLMELPQEIEHSVRHILGVESLEDVMGITEHESQLATYVTRFLDQSRHNARSCSLEGDWKASLFSLMGDLAKAASNAIHQRSVSSSAVSGVLFRDADAPSSLERQPQALVAWRRPA
jgi:hypothetical protein